MVGTRSLVTVVINNGRVLAETLLKKPSQVHSNEIEAKKPLQWTLVAPQEPRQHFQVQQCSPETQDVSTWLEFLFQEKFPYSVDYLPNI